MEFEYKRISGYERYYLVSTGGDIIGLRNGNKLSPSRDWQGYARVELIKGPRVRKTFFVHRLVLEAFVGLRGDKDCCRHLDGNPGNNRASNLSWGTHLENARDKFVHGTVMRGPKNHRTKFVTEEAVRIIENSPESAATLASRYGISKHVVYKIKHRIHWLNRDQKEVAYG